jgi:predicted PurR-regulated permease PerM
LANKTAPNAAKSGFYKVASVAIVVGMLYFAQDVFVPLALAVLFAFLLAPAAARLERLGLRRVASTLVTVLAAIALLGSFGWVMEQRFAAVIEHVPEYRESIQNKYRQLLRNDNVVAQVQQEIKQTVADATGAATQPATLPANSSVDQSSLNSTSPLIVPTPDSPWPVRLFPEPPSPIGLAIEYMGKIVTPLLTALLVIVLVIFMLIGREDLRDRIFYLFGSGRLHVATEALDEAATRVSSYLVAQSLINVMFGVFVAVGLTIVDIAVGHGRAGPGDILLAAAICAVLRFIPYAGTWIGALLPLGFAFVAYNGYGVFFYTLGMFVGIELLTSQAIEPNFLGSRTGMSPIAVLVSAVFWTWLWGPIGLLLSTPLTVLLVVMGKYAPQLEFLNVMLSDRPIMDPPMRVYQRLVVGNEQGAIDIAQECLKEMPLERIYDDLIIPALAAAEQDRNNEHFDDTEYAAICQSFREVVEALSEYEQTHSAKLMKSNHYSPSETADPSPAPLPRGAEVRVLCLPAQNQADEIVGLMLAKLLERRGYQVQGLSAESLASEMVDGIDRHKCDVVVVSALPPHAVSHCRYIFKRLTVRHPDLKVILGLWTHSGQGFTGHDRDFGTLRPATTLRLAQEQLDQLSHSIRLEPENAAVEAGAQNAAR